MENAIKYFRRLDHSYYTGQDRGQARLQFIDEGIGVPAAEKKNIFRKFYRIGKEETRKTKGTGLGLYIVKYIIDEHGGDITVADNTPKGSIFDASADLENSGERLVASFRIFAC